MTCCENCNGDSLKPALPQPAYFAAIREPIITADMTEAQRRAEMDRWLDERQAASVRRDEEDLVLGMSRSASVCQTHEIEWTWTSATASRWYQALPERWMRDAPAEMTQKIMERRLARADARGLPASAVHGHPRIVPLAHVKEKLAQRQMAQEIIEKIRSTS